MRRSIAIFLLAAFALSASPITRAGIIVPSGLNPGDHYYLAFVTRDSHDGLSDLLSTYNDFVEAQAALNPAITGTNDGVAWRAVASTPLGGQNAGTNLSLDTHAPVYLIDGLTRISNGSGGFGPDFWLTPHLNPINEDQFGNIVPSDTTVWTGTDTAGGIQYPLGFTSAFTTGTVGSVGPVGPDWVDTGLNSGSIAFTEPYTNLYPFYAVSTEVVVPTPEPSTFVLGIAGVAGLGFATLRKKFHRV